MMIRVVMFSAILFAAASVSAAAETGDDGGRLVIGQGANSCWAWTQSHEGRESSDPRSVHAMGCVRKRVPDSLRPLRLLRLNTNC